MLGVSQNCNQPCNHEHKHEKKGQKIVKKQVKSLTMNQSNQWITIQQQIRNQFSKLKKLIEAEQKQIFLYIQRQKQKEAKNQTQFSQKILNNIKNILAQKYQAVTCKEVAELIKLAKAKNSNIQKRKEQKSTLNSSKSKIIKTKEQKIVKNSEDQNKTVLSQKYLQIKSKIFENINRRLNEMINSQQNVEQKRSFDNFPNTLNQSINNSSFISQFEEKQQWKKILYYRQQNQKEHNSNKQKINNQQLPEKQNILKKQEEQNSSYLEYTRMMKQRESNKNQKWNLEIEVKEQKPQVEQKFMKKKQKKFYEQEQQKKPQKNKQADNQKQQTQYSFQDVSIVPYEQFVKVLNQQNAQIEPYLQDLQESFNYQDSQQQENQSTYLQKPENQSQSDSQQQNLINESIYLKQAKEVDLQQQQKKMQQQAIRRSLQTYEQQKNRMPESNFQINPALLRFRIEPQINPLLRERFISIDQLQGQKFRILHNKNKFDMFIKVVRPVQLTILKLVEKSLLKIKFIATDGKSMAVFYTNYDPKIKKDACIILPNCEINHFKNQYQIVCKSHLKSQNFFPSNSINFQISTLKNTFSRILTNSMGQLSYSIPSSQQMKLSQCVKTFYRNVSHISLISMKNLIKINKQVIVCILKKQKDEYIVGDYSGRMYAKLPNNLNSLGTEVGDTVMLIRPIMSSEKQKLCLYPERIFNFKQINFEYQTKEIPNIILNKNNVS